MWEDKKWNQRNVLGIQLCPLVKKNPVQDNCIDFPLDPDLYQIEVMSVILFNCTEVKTVCVMVQTGSVKK